MNKEQLEHTPQGLLSSNFGQREKRAAAFALLFSVLLEPSAQSRLQVLAEGNEVIDKTTGLIWKRCAQGQVWNGTVCPGAPSKFSFDAAMAVTFNPSGWRMPNIKELFSIAPKSDRSIYTEFHATFQNVSGEYWSATPQVPMPGAAWTVDFNYAATLPSLRFGPKHVRLVKNAFDSTEGKSWGQLNDTGISSDQCVAPSTVGFVSCNSTAAALYGNNQDAMTGRDATHPDGSDGQLGFSYKMLSRPDGNPYPATECVMDSVTGLMWEGKPSDGSIRNHADMFTNFDSALVPQVARGPGTGVASQDELTGKGNTLGYIFAVNASALCGFSDWRLPTADELTGLIHFGKTTPPMIESTWFPNTQPSMFYWTSEGHNTISGSARIVNFSIGRTSSTSRSTPGYIRLVRTSATR